jgi:acyl-coenzyme A thioesterase PaaI-like protein
MAGAGDELAQDDVSRSAIAAVSEFLGTTPHDDDVWSFQFGEHLVANWGGVYGGAVAAAVLSAARGVAPARSPTSLHIQFIRAVPPGTARAELTMRHVGRVVATVQTDLFDPRHKLTATALITMVTPTALAAEYNDTTADALVIAKGEPLNDDDLAQAEQAPVSRALGMHHAERRWIANRPASITGTPPGSIELVVPWTDLEHTGPEAACLAADPANGAPIHLAFRGHKLTFPNTDLSLRFTTASAQREVTAAGTLVSMQRGTATIAIEVQAGDEQLAHGLSSSLLMTSP